MGTCKPMGLLLMGANLPAIDPTAARIMGLSPEKISNTWRWLPIDWD